MQTPTADIARMVACVAADELARRPSRAPDYAAENRALVALARALAADPGHILQRLAETALELCRAHSAGFSLLSDDGQRFRWAAVAGEWARHVGGGTPRDFGPCGMVLDRDAPMLFSHPESHFEYLADATPPIDEGLLLPFYVGGKALGTIWVISHRASRRFDAEDHRVMTSLAAFASAAYQAQRQTEERLSLAFEAGRMGSWEWHVAENRVVWSPGLEALHGLEPGTFPGTFEAYQRDIHPDDREHVQRAVAESFAGDGTHQLEYRIVRPDGSERWVEGRGRVFRDAQGQVTRLMGVCADITERKRTEQALRDSEERMRTLLGMMPAGVYTCEAPSGRISYYNDHAARLWGRAPSLGDTEERFCGSYRLYWPDGRLLAHADTPMAVALREGRAFRNAEAIVERPDGSRITCLVNIEPLRDAAGRIVGAINVFHDVSALKEARDSLRASESRLGAELADMRRLQELSAELVREEDPQALYEKIIDAAVGIMRSEFASVQMLYPERGSGGELRLLAFRGFKPEAAKFWEWVRADSRSTCGEALRTGRRSIAPDVELCAFMAGSEDLAMYLQTGIRAVQTTPLIARSGNLVGMLSTHWRAPHAPSERDLRLLDVLARQAADLMDNARLHEQRVKLVAELQEADRRKDEFLATLSHELRNPLAPLKNALQLLELSGSGDARIAPLRDMMERQVNHLVRLVDDLLEMARISRGALELRRERVPVSAVVRSALETSQPLIRAAAHQLSLELPGEPLWLDGDPVRLAQIVANLLNNAAKYTERGGRIAVAARRREACLELTVRDNGMGIPADVLPRLFEMFSRGGGADHGGQGGLGIGLALARRLAEMHGGTLVAASEGPGRGAEFRLTLPLAAGPEEPAADAPGVPRALPARRVLIVDDNRDAAHSLGMVLKYLGVDVQVAHDGAQALETLRAYEPGVVFLDIGMPGMDGYEVARRIRAARPSRMPAIVALTGWGQEQDRRRAREAGFDHHLVKPADLSQLQALLASLEDGPLH